MIACLLETDLMSPIKMTPLTKEQHDAFQSAESCFICELPFSESDIKCKDHDHLTGKYRGPTHNSCNLNYKKSFYVPVIFHNLSGYDAHFIIKEINSTIAGKINLLPLNKEKYISFTKYIEKSNIQFRFIDSYKFLGSSLDSLAKNLTEFPNLKSQFKNLNEIQFNLLQQKGIFPYDYMDSSNKFLDTKLPEKKFFYNELNKCDITDSDYNHAQTIWNEFNIKNLGEYSDIYLKIDILLLSDIFEKFRKSCMKTYDLDPAHYFTLPGFSWNAMLKYNKIKFELLTDVDMLLFVENGIRGGLTQVCKRYSQANNMYMTNYDPKKSSSYITYFDINNQYGWAMSQYLPYMDFE